MKNKSKKTVKSVKDRGWFPKAWKESQRLELLRKAKEIEILTIPNELLRSAYSVALRKGQNTNWKAFTKLLRKELGREHKIMFPLPKKYLTK